MGNTLNKPILQEYLSPGQSRMVADRAEIIGEDGQKKKHWYLNGIFIQGEIENLNGRIYPREEIHSAIDQLNEQIKSHGAVLGELDHPDTLVINVHNVSHVITDIHAEGNNGIGRMKILPDVPSGKIVEGLLSSNVPLGVSSRGSGNVDEYTNRVSDFDIITVDIVATPSAQDARPTPIYEQLQQNRGKKIFNNAKDCILSNHKYTQELNEDIVNWIKSWKPNR